MSKQFERQVILVKNETEYGSDPTPTPADNAISVAESSKPEFDPQVIEQGNPMPSLSKLKPLIGAKATKIALKAAFYGSGSKDTAPRIGDLIEGCGFKETVNAESNVEYEPASEDLKSNTIYQYLSGAIYKILGAVGNLKISGKYGEPAYFDFDIIGLYQDDADLAVAAPTFESNYKSPPQCLSASFTLDSIDTFKLREFNIDMGIPVINGPDMAQAHGYAGFTVGKRNPSGNIIIEAVTKATYDFLAKFEAATEVAAVLNIGSVEGNKLGISIPNLSYTNVGIESGDGITLFNIPISLNLGSGDDEIKITHS